MKTINQIIGEYVEKNDVKGLADYFRAYIADEMLQKEIPTIESSKCDGKDGCPLCSRV